MKIIGSTWFSPLRGRSIGIVLINNGIEERAYIGTAMNLDQRKDEEHISKVGAKFPLELAKRMIK